MLQIIIIGLRYFDVCGPKEKYKGKAASMIYQLFYRQMKSGKRPRILNGENTKEILFI